MDHRVNISPIHNMQEGEKMVKYIVTLDRRHGVWWRTSDFDFSRDFFQFVEKYGVQCCQR